MIESGGLTAADRPRADWARWPVKKGSRRLHTDEARCKFCEGPMEGLDCRWTVCSSGCRLKIRNQQILEKRAQRIARKPQKYTKHTPGLCLCGNVHPPPDRCAHTTLYEPLIIVRCGKTAVGEGVLCREHLQQRIASRSESR